MRARLVGPEAGRRVAAWLRGSWRESPPRPTLELAEAEAVAPILDRSGCTGLGWWAIRGSSLASTPLGSGLQERFRLQVLHAAVRERAVAELFARLREAGLFGILGKGWAAAEAYAHRGLRPYGDYDIYVEPAEAPRASAALQGTGQPVDLHRGLAELADRSWADIRARARVRPAAAGEARVFGAEDHLRLIALHMLRHGAWRPLWLCDVGAALEALPDGFDWDYALRGRPSWTEGVRTALHLAGALLGADLSRLPRAVAGAPPAWITRCVLRQWSTEIVPHGHRRPFSDVIRRPADLPRELRLRWPNAVEATFDLGLGFGRFPFRLPVQVADCVVRALRFLRSRPRT